MGSSLVSSLLGAVPIAWMIGIEVRNKMIHGRPSWELTDPTLGKGKSSTQKYLWDGDMLVSGMVLTINRDIATVSP